MFPQKRIIWLAFLVTTRVEGRGWQQYIQVSVLVVEVVLIAEDTGVLLACNPLTGGRGGVTQGVN